MGASRFLAAPARPFRGIGFVCGLAACLLSGCASGSMSTVPPAWRHTNPWGPEAYEARARGELHQEAYTPEMARWAEFARQHIQDGDILFRYGRTVGVSDFLACFVLSGLTDSRFTHDALAFRQGDTVYVYDAMIEPQRLRKIPFEYWMLDTVPGTLAIKRLRPEFRDCVPQALEYCEAEWLRQPAFDYAMRLDDDRFYCSEFVEKAYRSAGLALTDPVPIRDQPHYVRYSLLGPVARLYAGIQVDEPVFTPGNGQVGTYSSPCLELVYTSERAQAE